MKLMTHPTDATKPILCQLKRGGHRCPNCNHDNCSYCPECTDFTRAIEGGPTSGRPYSFAEIEEVMQWTITRLRRAEDEEASHLRAVRGEYEKREALDAEVSTLRLQLECALGRNRDGLSFTRHELFTLSKIVTKRKLELGEAFIAGFGHGYEHESWRGAARPGAQFEQWFAERAAPDLSELAMKCLSLAVNTTDGEGQER